MANYYEMLCKDGGELIPGRLTDSEPDYYYYHYYYHEKVWSVCRPKVHLAFILEALLKRSFVIKKMEKLVGKIYIFMKCV